MPFARRSRAAVIVLALACACATASASMPPLEVKGIPLGGTRDQVAQRWPLATCSTLSCWIRPDEVERTLCGTGYTPAHTACREKARADYVFGPASVRSYRFEIRDGTIGQISVDFATAYFARMVIALQEKYGAPTSDRVETLQNRMGTAYENRVVKWERADGYIEALQRYAGAEFSVVRFSTPRFDVEATKDFVDKAKGSAKNL